MILGVFGVQIGDVELLDEGDHLRASEVAEGVTGDAKLNGTGLALAAALGKGGERGGGAGSAASALDCTKLRREKDDFIGKLRETQ